MALNDEDFEVALYGFFQNGKTESFRFELRYGERNVLGFLFNKSSRCEEREALSLLDETLSFLMRMKTETLKQPASRVSPYIIRRKGAVACVKLLDIIPKDSFRDEESQFQVRMSAAFARSCPLEGKHGVPLIDRNHFGALLYTLIAGEFPYENVTPLDFGRRFYQKELDFGGLGWDGVSGRVKIFIQRCLDGNGIQETCAKHLRAEIHDLMKMPTPFDVSRSPFMGSRTPELLYK